MMKETPNVQRENVRASIHAALKICGEQTETMRTQIAQDLLLDIHLALELEREEWERALACVTV